MTSYSAYIRTPSITAILFQKWDHVFKVYHYSKFSEIYGHSPVTLNLSDNCYSEHKQIYSTQHRKWTPCLPTFGYL